MALTDNLISFWGLEETSGTRVDAHGTNNLTDNNTVTSATGKVGTAGQFTNANSEYLSITDNASLSTGDIDFSAQAWVYFDSFGTQRGIINKGATFPDLEWVMRSNTSGSSGVKILTMEFYFSLPKTITSLKLKLVTAWRAP